MPPVLGKEVAKTAYCRYARLRAGFSLLLLRRYLPGLLPSEVRERANPFTGGKEHAEERKIGERDRVTSGTMEGSSGLPAGNSRMVRWLVQGRGSRREK